MRDSRRDRALGYTCDPARSIPGADRGLGDIEAAMQAIFAMPFVDARRIVIGGQSRGGTLSVAYAGAHPEQVRGVINFVGGWLGERCDTSGEINGSLMKRGARFPGEMLWLYGEHDPTRCTTPGAPSPRSERRRQGRVPRVHATRRQQRAPHLVVSRSLERARRRLPEAIGLLTTVR